MSSFKHKSDRSRAFGIPNLAATTGYGTTFFVDLTYHLNKLGTNAVPDHPTLLGTHNEGTAFVATPKDCGMPDFRSLREAARVGDVFVRLRKFSRFFFRRYNLTLSNYAAFRKNTTADLE